MKHSKLLISVAVILLLTGVVMQVSAKPVDAFEPIKDYWFSESIKLGEVKLPGGVDIFSTGTSLGPRASLLLRNQNKTPLYVMSLRYKDVLVMTTPDPRWKARVEGAQEAASYLVAPNHPAYLRMDALADLDPILEDRNVLSFDPPPESAPIPESQSSELLLVYQQQVIEVPFVVTYTLNTAFDNGSKAYYETMNRIQVTNDVIATAAQQAKTAEARVMRSSLLVGLSAVAILLIASWIVWRVSRRSQ